MARKRVWPVEIHGVPMHEAVPICEEHVIAAALMWARLAQSLTDLIDEEGKGAGAPAEARMLPPSPAAKALGNEKYQAEIVLKSSALDLVDAVDCAEAMKSETNGG